MYSVMVVPWITCKVNANSSLPLTDCLFMSFRACTPRARIPLQCTFRFHVKAWPYLPNLRKINFPDKPEKDTHTPVRSAAQTYIEHCVFYPVPDRQRQLRGEKPVKQRLSIVKSFGDTVWQTVKYQCLKLSPRDLFLFFFFFGNVYWKLKTFILKVFLVGMQDAEIKKKKYDLLINWLQNLI